MIISDDELQECLSLLNNPVRPTLGARTEILRRIEKRVQLLQAEAWVDGYNRAVLLRTEIKSAEVTA